jgi:hypothetical protein
VRADDDLAMACPARHPRLEAAFEMSSMVANLPRNAMGAPRPAPYPVAGHRRPQGSFIDRPVAMG